MKIITAAIMTIENAVPRSGCIRINPMIAPRTAPMGNSAWGGSSIRSMRRSRSAAMKRMIAIFANSDG